MSAGTEHFDSLETRDPAEREAAQFASLRALLDHAPDRAPAWADRLAGITVGPGTSPDYLTSITWHGPTTNPWAVQYYAGDDITLQVLDKAGRLCCNGRAGLGAKPPWDTGADGSHGGEGVLPGIEIGFEYLPHTFSPARDLCLGTVRSAGDETPWYADGSPWGGAIVPPEYLQVVALHLMREPHQPRLAHLQGVHGPGMWAQHDLAISGPLFQDQPYKVHERVADKGRSGRTIFLTYEFEIFDGNARRVAHGRHKAKWLADE